MQYKIFFVLLVLLVPVFNHAQQGLAQTVGPGNSYPEELDYFYNSSVFQSNSNLFLPYNHNQYRFTGSFEKNFTKKEMPQFRDVTLVSVEFFCVEDIVDHYTISASLNGQNATNSYSFNGFGWGIFRKMVFILDNSSHAMSLTNNILHFYIDGYYLKNLGWNYGYGSGFQIRIVTMTVRTAFRQSFSDSGSLNASNSHITALLFDQSVLLNQRDFYNTTDPIISTDYTIPFLLVLPQYIENFQKQIFLNITISSNQPITLSKFFLENFAIVASSVDSNSVNYLMKYVHYTTESLSTGSFHIHLGDTALTHIKLSGILYVSNEPVQVFPKSKEMGIALFLTVTLAIPVVLLSKLIYRRLFY